VRAEAQFWNGTAFQLNEDDRCTQILVPETWSIATKPQATIYCNGGIGLYGSLSGVTASMNGVVAGAKSILSKGKTGLVLGRPAGNSSGFLDLALSVPDYLKFDWDGVDQTLNTSVEPSTCTTPGDGDMFDDSPRARIRFGIKRNDKVIYLREVY